MDLTKIEVLKSFQAVKDFLSENSIKENFEVKCTLNFIRLGGNHIIKDNIEVRVIDYIPAYRISTKSLWTYQKSETVSTSDYLFKYDAVEKSLTTQIDNQVLLKINKQL
jgi:hypothetical protein